MKARPIIAAFASVAMAWCGLVLAQDPQPSPDAAAPVTDAEPAPDSETPAPVVDEDAGPTVPVPYPVSRYETAWAKNPFWRVTKVTEQAKESVLKDWALNGMASYAGKIRVTLVNKQTGEYKHLTNQDGPEAEFRLIKANFNRNRSEASAEIEKSGEKATVTYDENLTAKPVTIQNTQRQNAAPGAPGVPGAPGQQSVQPGQQVPPPRPGAPVTAATAAGGRPMPAGAVPGRVNVGAAGQPVVAQPGTVPNAPTAGQPVVNGPVPIGGTPAPAPLSRRRQLVPAPVIPAQQ